MMLEHSEFMLKVKTFLELLKPLAEYEKKYLMLYFGKIIFEYLFEFYSIGKR